MVTARVEGFGGRRLTVEELISMIDIILLGKHGLPRLSCRRYRISGACGRARRVHGRVSTARTALGPHPRRSIASGTTGWHLARSYRQIVVGSCRTPPWRLP